MSFHPSPTALSPLLEGMPKWTPRKITFLTAEQLACVFYGVRECLCGSVWYHALTSWCSREHLLILCLSGRVSECEWDEAKMPAVCGVPICALVCVWGFAVLAFLFLSLLRVCDWNRNSCVNFARNLKRWPPLSRECGRVNGPIYRYRTPLHCAPPPAFWMQTAAQLKLPTGQLLQSSQIHQAGIHVHCGGWTQSAAAG